MRISVILGVQGTGPPNVEEKKDTPQDALVIDATTTITLSGAQDCKATFQFKQLLTFHVKTKTTSGWIMVRMVILE